MRFRVIILCICLILSGRLYAQEPDSTTVAIPVPAEMEQPADTLEMSDEDIMKLLASPQQDTVVKVVDRGFDVSRMINARRQRAEDYTPFIEETFMSNTFVSAKVKTNKLLSEDYSYGFMGGASFGKWIHQDHALRLDYTIGKWQDNFDGSAISSMELDASYLFNLSAYVGGYKTNRLCEVMIVSGIGYANSFHKDKLTHAFNAHVGANFNLRLFNGFDLFVEPSAGLYTNGMAVSYAGNWRTWLTAFQTSVGLTYNINPSKSPASPNLKPQTDGWFLTMYGGPHVQNSKLVYDHVGLSTSLGVHMAIGVGKYYTDFFSVRYSGTFSRGTWVTYGADEFPCSYFSVRAEGLVDFFSLLSNPGNGKKSVFGASLVFGPEIGYMHKVDHELLNFAEKMIICQTYIGLSTGAQFKFRVSDRLGLYLEPRFSLVPYKAPYYDERSLNDYRNYYDGIYNLNFGIEFLL